MRRGSTGNGPFGLSRQAYPLRALWRGSMVWAEDREELSAKVHAPGSRWAREESLRRQTAAGPQNLQAEGAEEVSPSDCVDAGGRRQDLPSPISWRALQCAVSRADVRRAKDF